MNATRLHTVVDKVLHDYEELEIESLLKNTVDALRAWANDTNSETSSAYEAALSTLSRAASLSTTNYFLPYEESILRKIDGHLYTGAAMLSKIKGVFDETQMPANAHQQAASYFSEFKEYKNHLSNISSAFKTVGIGHFKIPENKHELTVMLPHDITDSTLHGFYQSIYSWDQNINHLQDALEGTRESLTIDSLDKGSDIITLIASPVVAKVLLSIVNSALDIRIKILQIRKLKQEILSQELDSADEHIELLKQDENSATQKSIDQVVDSIKKNHLTSTLTPNARTLPERVSRIEKAVEFIYYQIDNGVKLELPPAEEPDDSIDNESDNNGSPSHRHNTNHATLEVIQKWIASSEEDSPILQLENPENKNTDTDDSEDISDKTESPDDAPEKDSDFDNIDAS